MKKLKRYDSEQSIIDDIDSLKMKIIVECQEAETLDKEADWRFKELSEISNPERLNLKEQESYSSFMTEAKEKRKRAAQLRSVQDRRARQLKTLKAVLSEFRTKPMGFLGGDTSVALNKS